MEKLQPISSSFGELLKIYRKRKRLTQWQLAQRLSMHANTISSWELGTYLPATRGLVLELARHLELDEMETRSLLEASLTALSPYWHIPFPRNPFFTGREDILGALHAQLGVERAVALLQSSALHGLGGIGKTQIALEYAYRYALEYSAVLWIEAETSERIIASLLRIAHVLRLPERDERDRQRTIAAVQRWLSTSSQWLLIWDNLDDLDLLHDFLPPTRQGAVLLTTRCQALGTLAAGIDLCPMEQEEGIFFLLRRAKVLEPEAGSQQVDQFAIQKPSQYAAAAELVTAMGGLPLALDQAGAYIEETHCRLSAYLDIFSTRRATLLRQRGDRAYDHPASVSTTFALAITETRKRHPAAAELLRVCALLQPDAIPEELFCRGAEHLGALLEDVCCDPLDWNLVVAGACAYSLLQRQPEEQTLSVHRLVQAVVLGGMTEAEQELWSGRAIGALDAAFPEVLPVSEYATWRQAERLLPHALCCLSRAGAAAQSSIFASLAYKTAQYLCERGQYAQAEPLFWQALHIQEQVLGPDHPEIASFLNSLALLAREQGKYAQAEPLVLRALHIRERVLGPDHPEIASSLNSLAALYWSLGEYGQAEHLLRRALRIWEQTLGPDHPEVARPLNNLGLIYGMQGKYAQAEPLLLRALHVWEQSLGPEHPTVADALHNLAELSRDQGQYIQAEELFLRVLHIRVQALGTEHPLVAYVLHDLAEAYLMQGKYEQAEPLYQRALAIREQSLGTEHALVAEPLNGLANLCREQGQYEQAKRLYQRALSIREHHLGHTHPDTAQTLHDLALLQQKQGNLHEARSLAERALQIRSQSLGDIHSKTIATQALYAQLLQELACVQEAAASELNAEGAPASHGEESRTEEASSILSQSVDPSCAENDALQGFLDACCELHPLAWCRIGDLWYTYEQWTACTQKCLPLSRRAFAAQLRARGCRADRTSTARIWRGIRLVDKAP